MRMEAPGIRPAAEPASGAQLQAARLLPKLRGAAQVIANIEDPSVIEKILVHLACSKVCRSGLRRARRQEMLFE
jgi:hypothetical protein